MSDYLVTSAELTETADAIRAKTGDSNAIEWESGTGFADALAAIPTGGSGPRTDTGTYTPASNVTNFTVSHSLGVVPDEFEVRAEPLPQVESQVIAWSRSIYADSEIVDQVNQRIFDGTSFSGGWLRSLNGYWNSSLNYMLAISTGANNNPMLSSETAKIATGANGSAPYFKAGQTYRWVVTKY